MIELIIYNSYLYIQFIEFKMENSSGIYEIYNTDNVKENEYKLFPHKSWSYLEKYWISKGFPHITSTKIINETIEGMIEDIKILNNTFFTAQVEVVNPIISVDGTCCTGKSTLARNFINIKSNDFMSNIGMNLHPAGALGYYFTSLKLFHQFYNDNFKTKIPIITDRTAWNNYLWGMIWKIIAYFNVFKPELVPINAYTQAFDMVLDTPVYSDMTLNMMKILLDLIHPEILESLISYNKCIFIVDSNELETRQRLKNRNTDSDLERSEWDDYITIQNFAYAYIAQKYPQYICLIDLHKYNFLSHSDKMEAIARIIKELYHPTEEYLPNTCFENLHPDKICRLVTVLGKEHERYRPIEMDKFSSQIKYAYAKYVEDE
ncbi:p-loop NTPase/TK3 [Macrobrachium rosenbergii nudivirus]|nr:p-loop NTPase/TK3 [Macrobrachium rosenbergii nudivirus]